MNREEQILKASIEDFENLPEKEQGTINGFRRGAKWSDNNPTDTYWKVVADKLAECLMKAQVNWSSRTSNWKLETDIALADYRKKRE